MFLTVRDSVLGIQTYYVPNGPGIESRWGAIPFTPVQTVSGARPVSYTIGTGSFPGIKRPGRGVNHPSPSLALRLKKE